MSLKCNVKCCLKKTPPSSSKYQAVNLFLGYLSKGYKMFVYKLLKVNKIYPQKISISLKQVSGDPASVLGPEFIETHQVDACGSMGHGCAPEPAAVLRLQAEVPPRVLLVRAVRYLRILRYQAPG